MFPCHNEEVSDILDKCSFNTGIVSWHTGRVPESKEMCNGYCSNFIIIQWWPLICLTKTSMQVCSKLFSFLFLSTFMLIFYCEYYPVVVYSPIWNKFLMKIYFYNKLILNGDNTYFDEYYSQRLYIYNEEMLFSLTVSANW